MKELEAEIELYHFSEEPDIREFIPRSPIAQPEKEPLVWAIDAEFAPLYYFPRDCPRVGFWLLETTNQIDRDEYLKSTSAPMAIAVEFGWLDRIRAASLYQYRMPPHTFQPESDSSVSSYGAYVSKERVVPESVEAVGDLLKRLEESKIELRLCPSLQTLSESLAKSSLHFSLIRMRNATRP